jgi:hypothetical protein
MAPYPRLVYSTCLYCHSALGANEVVESFPVGKRLAFDAKQGRLWVVCSACGRWNLTPLDDRWVAIEDCDRLFRATRVRVTTSQIGLCRLRDGTELVRIGTPLRPEFAAWRYGDRFVRRRARAKLAAGGAAVAAGAGMVAFAPVLVPALSVGAISLVAVPGITSLAGVLPLVGLFALREHVIYERVVGKLRRPQQDLGPAMFNWPPKSNVITVRAKHAAAAELRVLGHPDDSTVTLDVPHDGGWAHFEGLEAMQAASTVLAGSNRFGASQAQVEEAVGRVEEMGDATTYLRSASSLGDSRHSRLTSVLNIWRGLGSMRLSRTECLALEMSLHEESERRALEGELALLAAAWQEAEELARVADSL